MAYLVSLPCSVRIPFGGLGVPYVRDNVLPIFISQSAVITLAGPRSAFVLL